MFTYHSDEFLETERPQRIKVKTHDKEFDRSDFFRISQTCQVLKTWQVFNRETIISNPSHAFLPADCILSSNAAFFSRARTAFSASARTLRRPRSS
jgi:hypothetical protein